MTEFHHERYDGRGYPLGLGETIPLNARIFAIADVFDALTTKCPYKESWPIPSPCSNGTAAATSTLGWCGFL
ncbi:MAG: HD-GYP domain-containing protein [Methylomicrobium sp.]